MKIKELTILSYGGGQDSTALLLKGIHNTQYKKRYIKGDYLIIMTDTGNEHKKTNEYRKKIETLCKAHNIDFMFLDLNYKYTSKSWSGGLIKFYEAGDRIGSKAYPKTCTDNLKIVPFYNFLDKYIHTKYNTVKVGRKSAIKEFVNCGGKINVILGIAKDEETRVSKNEDSSHKWQRDCINKIYPLIDLKMNRYACQTYIKQYMPIPWPSNCILCPFVNNIELLYLHRFENSWLQKWIELEKNKIQNNLHMGKQNLGVWGRKLLPEKVKEVIIKHGAMTDTELRNYKMSHGHCVKSKY